MFQELINAGVLEGDEFELDVAALPDYVQEATGSIEISEASYAFASIDEKQMVIGPAMVPNKLIVRKDEEGNPYYV